MRLTLTYHSIDSSGSAISVPPEAFDAHLAWFTSGRVPVVSLDTLITASHAPGDAVAITFDDGFANIRGPVERLRAAGLPVTIFVVSGHAGGTNAWRGRSHPTIPTLPLLSWSDLEQLAARGVSLCAHTHTHPGLAALSDAAIDDELQRCRDELKQRLGVEPEHVAYPYGDLDDRVVARARTCYRFAHTTEFAGVQPGLDPMRLPRIDMYYLQRPRSLDSWGGTSFMANLAWIGARRLVRHTLFGGPGPDGTRRVTR